MIENKNKKRKKEEERILTGTFISNARGFGFVEIEEEDLDLYISKKRTKGAFHKDVVQVKVMASRHRKHREAQVVRILERGMKQVVGTYEQSGEHFGFVTPDAGNLPKDIFVPKEASKGAVTGHKVVVEITDYGNDRRNPEGKVNPGILLPLLRGNPTGSLRPVPGQMQ